MKLNKEHLRDLTSFNKVAIPATVEMDVDKEAVAISTI